MECVVVKEKKNRECALFDYMQIIQRSWTWARLTDEERKTFRETLFKWWDRGKIQGNYDARWNVMSLAYDFFLDALGYDPCNWREPDNEERPAF